MPLNRLNSHVVCMNNVGLFKYVIVKIETHLVQNFYGRCGNLGNNSGDLRQYLLVTTFLFYLVLSTLLQQHYLPIISYKSAKRFGANVIYMFHPTKQRKCTLALRLSI